jgi:AraC-like DNA-binding protein
MPSSAARSFTDPDDYASAIPKATYEITIMQRGQFAAELVHIELHSLLLRHFAEHLPRTAQIETWSGQTSIGFLTRPGAGIITSGTPVSSTEVIARTPHNQSHYLVLPGPASYGTISLPSDKIAAISTAMVGQDLTAPREFVHVRPAPESVARLQGLHRAACDLAVHAPAVLTQPEAASGLEQALIEAMMDCLGGGGEAFEDRAALRQHAMIMRRFRRAVEEKPDQAVFIPELCTLIGVSERTLRVCCQEHLGMSPKRYLLLRRMHLARRGLREGISPKTTVTEIATQYGFWQFGRFAGEFKALFGESPSAILARPAE